MSQSKRSSGGEGGMEEAGATGAGTGNRTGIGQAPEMALDLIREAQKTPPSSPGDARVLAEYRGTYIKEGETMGSRPGPAGAGDAQSGDPLLLDKLGERLAFERQGVRLYEGLIGKAKILGRSAGGPSVEDLEHILSEEKEHFRFLQGAVVDAGGDPTALTPCANIASVLSQGVVQIVTDPRTTVVQCLEAMLLAELADNDGWALLKQVVRDRGADDLLERIEEAEEREAEHLESVRGWLSALVAGTGAAKRERAKAGAPGNRARAKAPTAKMAPAPRKVKSKTPAKAPAKAGSRRPTRSR